MYQVTCYNMKTRPTTLIERLSVVLCRVTFATENRQFVVIFGKWGQLGGGWTLHIVPWCHCDKLQWTHHQVNTLHLTFFILHKENYCRDFCCTIVAAFLRINRPHTNYRQKILMENYLLTDFIHGLFSREYKSHLGYVIRVQCSCVIKISGLF